MFRETRLFTNYSEGREKLTNAFKLLRKEGLITKQNFMCCMSCGCSAIDGQATAKRKKTGKSPKGYVFYHRQDTDSLEIYGNVHLRYGTFYNRKDKVRKECFTAKEVGKLIIEKMNEVGLKTKWDGDTGHCVQVDVEDVGFDYSPYK
jgi:hypothetical protein